MEEAKRDPVRAYRNILKAVQFGVTFFDQLIAYFKDNFETLCPVFCEIRKPPTGVDTANRTEMENLHEAYVAEIKNSFMAALGKDRMYRRPCGSVNDNQIWMLGVLLNYFIKSVLHMDHKDFTRAVKEDLGPLLGDTGLWALKNFTTNAMEAGNDEDKKKARVATDLVAKYLETGMDALGQEKQYNRMNKFSAKKMPDRQVRRNDMKFLYSWNHYAPLTWFESKKEY